MSQPVAAASATPDADNTLSGQGVLDSTAYPHLVDMILLNIEPVELVTLRAVSRKWRAVADARLAAHPVVQYHEGDDGTNQPTWLGSAVSGRRATATAKDGSQWVPRFELRSVDDTDDSDFDPSEYGDHDSDDDYATDDAYSSENSEELNPTVPSSTNSEPEQVNEAKAAARRAKALLVRQRAYSNKLFSEHATILDLWGSDVHNDRPETVEQLLKPESTLGGVTTMRVMAPHLYWYPPLRSTTIIFCGSQGGFLYLSPTAQRLVVTFLTTPRELGRIMQPEYETTYPGDPDAHYVLHFVNSNSGPKRSYFKIGKGETLNDLIGLLSIMLGPRSKCSIVGARRFFMRKLGLPADADDATIAQAIHDVALATIPDVMDPQTAAEQLRRVKFVDPAAYEAEVGAWQVDLETKLDPYRGERATYHA